MPVRPERTLIWPTPSVAVLWGSFREKIIRRRFVQDVGVLTAANVATAGVTFAQGMLVARWLGPELYGVVALAMSYPALVYAVFDARTVAASIKYLSEYHARGEPDRVLAMCKLGYLVDCAVACATFLVLVFTASVFAENVVHDPAIAGLVIVYGGALFIRALVGTSNAVLVTLSRFSLIAAINIGITLLRFALIFGFVLAGWQAAGVIWANALAAAATGLVYGAAAWGIARRTWGGTIFDGKLTALKGASRQIFTFMAYTDLSALIATIPNQLDLLVLGYFRGPAEVGYYKLAKNISVVVRYLTKPLQTVTYPALARLAAVGDENAFAQKARQLLIQIGLPLGVLVLCGVAFISMVVPVLVGEAYLPAVGATQLLCVAAAIALGFFWTRPVYLARGNVRQMFIISSSVTMVFALLYPFLVRQWGYMGAAAWMLGLQVVGSAVSVSWLWKKVVGKKSEPADSRIGRTAQRNEARSRNG